MSTRARIAVVTGEGQAQSIYCGISGYLERVGATLQTHWTSTEKIHELIESGSGDCSSLGIDLDDSIIRDDSCGRLIHKGDNLEQIQEAILREKGCHEEYIYLWTGRRWIYCKNIAYRSSDELRPGEFNGNSTAEYGGYVFRMSDWRDLEPDMRTCDEVLA